MHDYFEPQPVTDASVFILRNILHNWSDKYCTKILQRLRDAAAPHTQLLVIDNLVAYACVDERMNAVPGAATPLPPAPLLPNNGHANALAYYEDLLMLELLNGKQRTVAEMRVLLEETGWKLARVVQSELSGFSAQKVIAVPA